MQWLAVVALLLAGCEGETPAPVVPQEPTPVVAFAPRLPRPRALPIPPIPVSAATDAGKGDEIATLGPDELLAAADRAKSDATGYVAWGASKAENIDVLTELTGALNAATKVMRAGQVDGHYRQSDVAVTRDAFSRLRAFLSGKGD